MIIDEFIILRNVKIKDTEHKRIIELFYPYLNSVSGDKHLLPSILGRILGINLTDVFIITGCFNGVNDTSRPPYDNVDFYVRFSNNIKVFIYGRKTTETVTLNDDEYVIFVNSDHLSDNIIRKENHHIIIQ